MITDAYFFGIINQEYLTGFDILDLQIDERRVFNMFSDVELRLKKRRKILFSAESESLERLSSLISVQNRRTLVMWALDCAGQTLKHFEERYPVTEKINYYCERLIYWQENADLHELEWADFLTRDKA